MSKVDIGKAGDRNVGFDLDVLLTTRLLIQANSGGGKSWLLRRLAEQLFGKIPVLIIDPEGEFATLREKYGYVLVGKGGETPADPRSAQLVAHKLLELRASAVCDIYELKPHARHNWVKLFLEALIDAPKNLWRPTIVIVDEAHVFCPEKGQGESEAFGAMQDLVTRGRKRGFCAVFATQRLSKLSKNVSAEMLNRLVGQTFEDLDLERASDLLSVAKADKLEFFRLMKVMERGHFWAFGRAVAKDRMLVRVGNVETTHPEPGSASYSASPPPPPERIKGLLPKLADLPKAAEEKARTEADLRSEIRSLKGQLAARPKELVPQVETKTVERPVLKDSQVKDLDRIIENCRGVLQKAADAMTAVFSQLQLINSRPAARGVEPIARPVRSVAPLPREPRTLPAPSAAAAPPNGDEVVLDRSQRAVLTVLAQYHAEGCTIGKLALLSGYRQSGGFRNTLASLRTSGCIVGSNGGTMKITDRGIAALGTWDPLPEAGALLEFWIGHPSFGEAARKCIRALADRPDGLDIGELAAAAGYQISGGFRNTLSDLRTSGVMVGRNGEKMRLCDDLLEAINA